MPNYLQTVIYKIEHKENKELVYVGSTVNFEGRKSSHKSHCNNENVKEYSYKLYVMIRENGGWDSFEMLEIKKFPCNNKREAELEEERCRIELKATMNTNKAFVAETQKEYDKIYYEANKEKSSEQRKEQQKKYYEANKEKINERKRELRKHQLSIHVLTDASS